MDQQSEDIVVCIILIPVLINIVYNTNTVILVNDVHNNNENNN